MCKVFLSLRAVIHLLISIPGLFYPSQMFFSTSQNIHDIKFTADQHSNRIMPMPLQQTPWQRLFTSIHLSVDRSRCCLVQPSIQLLWATSASSRLQCSLTSTQRCWLPCSVSYWVSWPTNEPCYICLYKYILKLKYKCYTNIHLYNCLKNLK